MDRDLDLSDGFAVIVHDVAPAFARPIAAIVDALAPRVGTRVAAAVVPCWHGVPLDRGDAAFLRLVRAAFGEILQHGCTHRQDRPGPIALASGRSNEFTGLAEAEASDRLETGRAILDACLPGPVAGFVAPAWQVGRLTTTALARLGFRYRADFDAIRPIDGPPIPLVTWSWDWGVVAALGRAGEAIGDGLSLLRPRALPCVVLHPIDVDRGHLSRGLRVVDRLLERGRSPILVADWFAETTTAEASP